MSLDCCPQYVTPQPALQRYVADQIQQLPWDVPPDETAELGRAPTRHVLKPELSGN